MHSNYEKLARPTGPSIDTIAVPEKASLSPVEIKVTPPLSPSVTNISTPHSDRTANPFDTDIEAMMPTATATDSALTKNKLKPSKSECQVWPGRDHWKQQAKAAKKKRSCTCLARLSRRNRIIAKVLIGLLIVGIVLAIGFGISKPLGAPIWGAGRRE